MYLEKFGLRGRTAVVTGGGQGIGLACAEALGEAGARVVVEERPDAVVEAVRDWHASIARRAWRTVQGAEARSAPAD